jgi:hypothetical protein
VEETDRDHTFNHNTPVTNKNLVSLVGEENDDVEEDLLDEKKKTPTTNSVRVSSNDGDDNAVDPDVLRGHWAPLSAISKEMFCMMLLEHMPNAHNISIDNILCTEEIQGSNDFVRVLEVVDGPYADQYVVKVPGTGTSAR